MEEHESSGQTITRITVSGGIARSDLMCEILATVLDRPLERLESDEGPALGAAVTALAAMETHLRRRNNLTEPYTVADAVGQLVRFRSAVEPDRRGWTPTGSSGSNSTADSPACRPQAHQRTSQRQGTQNRRGPTRRQAGRRVGRIAKKPRG